MDREDAEEHSPLERLCFSQGELAVLKPLHTDAGQGAGMKKYCAREGGQGTRPTWAGAAGVPAAGQAEGTKGSAGVGV